MKTPSDEQIMAWVDGELPEDEALEIEQALEGDREAQQKAEIFRRSTAVLKAAFDDSLHEQVPEKLIRTIREHPSPRRAIRKDGFWAAFLRFPSLSPALAFAMAIVLCAGILTGYLLFGPSGSAPFPVLPAGVPFSRGLEKTASGNSFYMAGGNLKVTPVLSFRDNARRYCRQYEVESLHGGKRQWAQGVACRDRQGRWHTRVYIPSVPEQPASQNADSYVPAAGEDPMESVLDRMMAGPPLTAEQESALMRSGWKPKAAIP